MNKGKILAYLMIFFYTSVGLANYTYSPALRAELETMFGTWNIRVAVHAGLMHDYDGPYSDCASNNSTNFPLSDAKLLWDVLSKDYPHDRAFFNERISDGGSVDHINIILENWSVNEGRDYCKAICNIMGKSCTGFAYKDSLRRCVPKHINSCRDHAKAANKVTSPNSNTHYFYKKLPDLIDWSAD